MILVYDLRSRRIIEENIKLHKYEAYFYEIQHPELYNLFAQMRLRKEMAFLRGQLPFAKVRCLDIGSGTGNLVPHLTTAGFEVVACDLSVDMLKWNMAEHRVRCEAASLPFVSNAFEAITTSAVFHHLACPKKAVGEFERVSSKCSILYFDNDPYLIMRSRYVRRNIKSVYLLTFLLWLVLHPRKSLRLTEYIIWGRNRHLKFTASIDSKLTERNFVDLGEVTEFLQLHRYKISIKRYRHGALLRAKRS